MADEIKQKLSFDVTEFKAGISDMNRGIRIARNEFSAAAGALGDWRKSYEGIETRIKSLNDVMELQRAKVERLTKEYDDLQSTGTASEGALKKLQEQISKANADLGKTEGQLKEATDAQDKFGKETDDTTDELVRYGKKADEAGQKTGKFTEFLKKAGSVVKSGVFASAKAVGVAMTTIGVAAGAAVTGIYKLANEASDLQEAQNVVTATFKDGGEEINAWARTLASSAGVSQTSATKMVGTMGAMIKSMVGNEDAAEDMAKNLVQLSGDMASFYNLDAEDAFTKLRSGIAGETEPLKQLGIVMSVANLEAFALAEGINKSYKNMSEAEKTTLRYNYIMKQTADAQGDFVNTSDGLANSQRIMALEFENMKTTLGAMFIPAVTQAVQTASGLLSNINEALADGFQPEDVKVIGEQIGKVLSDGIASISKYLPSIIDTVASTLNELIGVIVDLLPVLLPALMDGAMQLMEGILNTIQENIGPITELAVLLVTEFSEFILRNLPMIITMGAQLIMSLLQGITDQLPELMPLILEVIDTLVTVIVDNLPLILDAGIKMLLALIMGIAEALPTIMPQIMTVLMEIVRIIIENLPLIIDAGIALLMALIDGLIESLPILIDRMPEIIQSIIDGLTENLDKLIDAAIDIILALGGALITNAPKLVSAAIEMVISLGKALVDNAWRMVQKVPELIGKLIDKFKETDWLQIGKDIIGGIADGIGAAAGALMDAAKNAANKALDSIKNFLGIASPSKVFQDEVGVNMGLGVAEGISQTSTDISDAMKGVTDKLKGDVQIDKNVNVTGGVTQSAGGSAILQIENFYNNTDKDIEQLAYEFEFARQKAAVALGG